ncbi:hypothetical protein FOS14_23365 [Skermania sp. ID1734]|uniref:hypothetical protein n=1 Tax=Skermania sp. ID1734 TaxID=2597516 RepID=UPI00117BF082|nr:hypothetical protein [Skermania sp. ID1734]TSD93355.1 hypothetical protein FOS14_23365 [Skermania sp. ID1734]
MGTVGVSTERGAVRTVVLRADNASDADSGIVRIGEKESANDDRLTTAAAIAAALDDLEADSDSEIQGAAVVYRDAAERRAIVSQLAHGKWSASSLVSVRAAHLAAVQQIRSLKGFGPLLVYDIVPGFKAFSVLDAAHSRILASDAISGSGIDAKDVGESVNRALSLVESADVVPDAVVLVGSLAESEVVRKALELGFSVPVVQAPESAVATARGAALLAARELPEAEESAAAAAPTGKRRLLIAAAAVLAAGAAGITALVLTAGSGSDEPTSPMVSAGPSPAARPLAPRVSVAPPPIEAPPPPAPAAPVYTRDYVPQWQPPPPRIRTPAETPDQITTTLPSPPPPPPPPPPTTTTLGPPGPNLLFPGEAPPPPASDGAALQKWWNHHIELKERWLSGH